MKTLKLTVSDGNTRLCRLPGERFRFFGYSFGRCNAGVSRSSFIGTKPSRKKITEITQRISQLTERHRLPKAKSELVKEPH